MFSFFSARKGNKPRKKPAPCRLTVERLEDRITPSVTLTERISIDSDGVQANNFSQAKSISADGRFVAFGSEASNLVAGDTNGFFDVFVHDRLSGTTERVSVASDGAQANLLSFRPSISADGRFIAFQSIASNLVAADTNGVQDIFVHDRLIGTTELVSVASDGTQGHGHSYNASISADGRFVAFESSATDLLAGDSNGADDIFVHDRLTGTTERVSVASDGTQGNGHSIDASISADGRLVAFASFADNLVAGDTNGTRDIFVHDRLTGTTERVSVDSDGVQANLLSFIPSISADGRLVAFASIASNLVAADTNGVFDIFVHDRLTRTTERVSVDSNGVELNGLSFYPSINADGRFVAFMSGADNLVAGDSNGTADIFVYDRLSGTPELVSVSSDGIQADLGAGVPAISADGSFVAYESDSSNLVAGDTNGATDIFVSQITRAAAPISITIDVGPGQVNVNGNGVLPSTLLSTADFDVTTLDVATLRFGGAAAVHYAFQDVNGDGRLDLVLHFRRQDFIDEYAAALAADLADGTLDSNHQLVTLTLTGKTLAGADVLGAAGIDMFMTGKMLEELIATL